MPRNKKIEFWDDERGMGNSLIVTLHYGWTFELGEHEGVRGFDTVQEANQAVKTAVRCNCQICQKELAASSRQDKPQGRDGGR